MSIEVSSHVWKHSKQAGSRLLLLVALADYTNAEGIAWPSIRSLCQRTRMSERYVQNMIRDLQAAGEIEIIRREGSSNVFRVICAPPNPEAPQGCTIVHPPPEPGSTPGVKRAAPITIMEPSREPLSIPNGKRQKVSKAPRNKPSTPSLSEAVIYGKSIGLPTHEGERFWNYHEAREWIVGDTPVRNWKAKMQYWRPEEKKAAPGPIRTSL